jgi:indolepyruvate ferredoxin oxidoreductase
MFGDTAERKMERALIAAYRAMIEAPLPVSNAANYATAVELANLPEQFHVRRAELLSSKLIKRAA